MAMPRLPAKDPPASGKYVFGVAVTLPRYVIVICRLMNETPVVLIWPAISMYSPAVR